MYNIWRVQAKTLQVSPAYEMPTTPRGFETKNQVAIFISNHSCYTRLRGGTLLSEMDSVMKWIFDWFLIDQEPLKKDEFHEHHGIMNGAVEKLLFVILTDVPEVKKIVF